MSGHPSHIVLVGLMGSGKTTVGRALAERLGRPFRDSDADLLARTGRSARDLAAAEGVEALHALELRHCLDALADPVPAVIGAAASVIDDDAGRDALTGEGARVVWLRIDPATAATRMRTGSHRPDHDLVAQAARRDPWFAAVADTIVDATADDAPTIAARLHAWVLAGTEPRQPERPPEPRQPERPPEPPHDVPTR